MKRNCEECPLRSGSSEEICLVDRNPLPSERICRFAESLGSDYY